MTILLNPGPVNLSERVRNALLRPDLCHREPEFSDLQTGIRQGLLDIYNLPQNDWAAILMTGSGTAAVEAMLTSFIPDTGKVLVLENGVYGERMSNIAAIHNIPHHTLHHEWGDEIDLTRLEATLNSEADITHIAMVHHETTTGRLNDIEAVASLCKSNNIPILLDGVSSFAAEEIDFHHWNIAACAATANKCLHGVPGTSFVVVDRAAMSTQTIAKRTLYFDLASYLPQQDQGGTPFTQSVQTFYALAEAIDELKEEGGWQQRQAIYRKRMRIVYEGLSQLGIRPMLEETAFSCVLNSFYLPDKMTYETLHDGLKQQGFVIYAGQGRFAKAIFRISVMGMITEDDLHRLVDAFKKLLN